MKPVSAWTASLQVQFRTGMVLAEFELQQYHLKVIRSDSCLWIVADWPSGGLIAFRAAFAANDTLEIKSVKKDNPFIIELEGVSAVIQVTIQLPESENAVFHYTTQLQPKSDLLIPYWPRDIMPLYKQGATQNTSGTIHTAQVGTRTGALFFSMEQPETGSVFYFQDLTSLSDYCQATETSAGDLVGGTWPEIGMTLPVTKSDKPLKAGEKYIVSDAYVLLSDEIPKDAYTVSRMYLDHLAEIYLLLPKPKTVYFDWPEAIKKSLYDLEFHKGCWQYAEGQSFLNAYIGDYKTPAESMVQLAVLLPLTDYDQWSGERHTTVINTLHEGLECFFDDQLHTLVRWLPGKEKNLDWEEEQKRPGVMDSWYLHHPLLNLSRLALKGDKNAEKILKASIEYVIKTAHHFKYEWPVFYDMATLEVLKQETQPGEGGEKDVPGTYSLLMLQMWELTGEKRFLNEAVRAAKKLKGLGFDIFYQANNTAFTAGAMLRLYKETGDGLFLDTSYLCIASLLKNMQLWESKYGYAKHYQSFFAVYPLKDAPYTAAFEEQEVYAGICAFLREADGIEIVASVKLLLAEFIKYCISRLSYYYPPRLPEEMLAKREEVKTGEIDRDLWIALEDLRDGWERSGQVGQEVYGAGVAFGIIPRQYFKVPKAGFMVFTEYLLERFSIRKDTVHIVSGGDSRLTFKIRILPLEGKKLPKLTLTDKGRNKDLQPVSTSAVYYKEFVLHGNTSASLRW